MILCFGSKSERMSLRLERKAEEKLSSTLKDGDKKQHMREEEEREASLHDLKTAMLFMVLLNKESSSAAAACETCIEERHHCQLAPSL
jgi:hypothetical protein